MQLTGTSLNYRQAPLGEQDVDHLILEGQLFHMVSLLPEMSTDSQRPRRMANIEDIVRMRLEVIELDATNLPGGERQKEKYIAALWKNEFYTADVNLIIGNTTTLARDFYPICIAYILSHNLPEGWRYSRDHGIISLKRDAVPYDREWPKFTIDEAFNHRLTPEQAKEHPWWRAALRYDTALHHAYVDAVRRVAEVVPESAGKLLFLNIRPNEDALEMPSLSGLMLEGVSDNPRLTHRSASDINGNVRLDSSVFTDKCIGTLWPNAGMGILIPETKDLPKH